LKRQRIPQRERRRFFGVLLHVQTLTMSTAIIGAFFKITSFAFVPRWTSASARHTFAIPNARTFSVPVTTRGRLSDIKPSSSIRASAL
jgi:hypothetical protein